MNVVVFSPHPDDVEVLMGGTIAKYTKKGHKVQIILVTIPNQKERRREESEKAAAVLGTGLSVLDLDPYKLAFDRRIVETFDQVLKDFQPDVIYSSWIHDSHQDHAIVAQGIIAATRKNNCSLYMYGQALPSGLTIHTFQKQTFVDISDTMETKTRAILAHKSQVEKFGEQWLEGITARARYIGCRINTKYAEAFEVVREIKKIE